jgi:hypothetical protein
VQELQLKGLTWKFGKLLMIEYRKRLILKVSLKISGEIEEIEKLVRLFVRKVDEDFD